MKPRLGRITWVVADEKRVEAEVLGQTPRRQDGGRRTGVVRQRKCLQSPADRTAKLRHPWVRFTDRA